MNAHQRRLKRRQEWRNGTAKATMRIKDGRVIELEQIWRPRLYVDPLRHERTFSVEEAQQVMKQPERMRNLGWNMLDLCEAIRKATQP